MLDLSAVWSNRETEHYSGGRVWKVYFLEMVVAASQLNSMHNNKDLFCIYSHLHNISLTDAPLISAKVVPIRLSASVLNWLCEVEPRCEGERWPAHRCQMQYNDDLYRYNTQSYVMFCETFVCMWRWKMSRAWKNLFRLKLYHYKKLMLVLCHMILFICTK